MENEIIQTQEEIIIKIKKEVQTLEDLNQAVINYLYKKISENKFLNDNDIKLFEIIYKN